MIAGKAANVAMMASAGSESFCGGQAEDSERVFKAPLLPPARSTDLETAGSFSLSPRRGGHDHHTEVGPSGDKELAAVNGSVCAGSRTDGVDRRRADLQQDEAVDGHSKGGHGCSPVKSRGKAGPLSSAILVESINSLIATYESTKAEAAERVSNARKEVMKTAENILIAMEQKFVEECVQRDAEVTKIVAQLQESCATSVEMERELAKFTSGIEHFFADYYCPSP